MARHENTITVNKLLFEQVNYLSYSFNLIFFLLNELNLKHLLNELNLNFLLNEEISNYVDFFFIHQIVFMTSREPLNLFKHMLKLNLRTN